MCAGLTRQVAPPALHTEGEPAVTAAAVSVLSPSAQVLEGKPIYVDCFGNLVPLTKSGQHHIFSFFAFKENRLPLFVKVTPAWHF